MFTARLSGIYMNLIMPFYAVRVGRNPGIYHTWEECQKQVANFNFAKFRKFSTAREALQFINDKTGGTSNTATSNGCQAQKNSSPLKKTKSSTLNSSLSSAASSTSSSSTSTLQNSSASSLQSIDYQLQITEEEMNLLREKLSYLQNKRAILLKEKALEEEKIQLSQEQSRLTTKVKSFCQKVKGPYTSACTSKPVTSGSWSQNRTTKLIEIEGTRKLHSKPSEYESTDGRAIVYTDGACSGNGTDHATAGIGVYWGKDHPLNVSERLPGRQTNNRAEIYAVVKALQQAKKIGLTEIVVRTDSQFLISSMTEWLDSWKRQGWKTARGKEVINKYDFLVLLKEMESIKVHWEHVAGHNGIEGNECADRLAVQGSLKCKIE